MSSCLPSNGHSFVYNENVDNFMIPLSYFDFFNFIYIITKKILNSNSRLLNMYNIKLIWNFFYKIKFSIKYG